MVTEEERVWAASPTPGVWMSTGAQWTKPKETEVVRTAGSNSSGNRSRNGEGTESDEKTMDKKKYGESFSGYLIASSVMD